MGIKLFAEILALNSLVIVRPKKLLDEFQKLPLADLLFGAAKQIGVADFFARMLHHKGEAIQKVIAGNSAVIGIGIQQFQMTPEHRPLPMGWQERRRCPQVQDMDTIVSFGEPGVNTGQVLGKADALGLGRRQESGMRLSVEKVANLRVEGLGKEFRCPVQMIQIEITDVRRGDANETAKGVGPFNVRRETIAKGNRRAILIHQRAVGAFLSAACRLDGLAFVWRRAACHVGGKFGFVETIIDHRQVAGDGLAILASAGNAKEMVPFGLRQMCAIHHASSPIGDESTVGFDVIEISDLATVIVISGLQIVGYDGSVEGCGTRVRFGDPFIQFCSAVAEVSIGANKLNRGSYAPLPIPSARVPQHTGEVGGIVELPPLLFPGKLDNCTLETAMGGLGFMCWHRAIQKPIRMEAVARMNESAWRRKTNVIHKSLKLIKALRNCRFGVSFEVVGVQHVEIKDECGDMANIATIATFAIRRVPAQCGDGVVNFVTVRRFRMKASASGSCFIV
ncbi:hypothetical protein ASG25_13595 [Rhizobium sp. Leaf384]|nr:hypothetical protein ASG25_13595 [Rhizobium sp. Leaf384]KQS84588.1 hypothetical protein ASG58_20945 [Rhizobium sp. Leaf383]